MGKEDNFIVAFELGSSKVTGIAGKKLADDSISILAVAQEPSTSFIRKGRIYNVNKMNLCIKNIKEKLEQKMKMRISRMYVGLGGMGMHTVGNTVVRIFEGKTEVTQEMVDAMSDENRASASVDKDILESVPQEYTLGTQAQLDPVGVLTESIEGHYLNIVASSTVREELRNCFKAAGVLIADLPITIQALASSMLTEQEKRSGCVFVDFGADTTSVAIYQNNLLRHLAVIPLGGANINRDLSSLQIEDDEAELLKLKFGSATPKSREGEEPDISLRDGRTIKHEEFAELVEARVEEIVQNVDHQIQLSGLSKKRLIGGLIVTGGFSQLKNLDQLLRSVTQFEKIRFARQIKTSVNQREYPDFNKKGECNAAIAILEKGEMDCSGGALGSPILFPEDDPVEIARKKEEEERLAREEKERLETEEAARIKEEEEAEKRRLEEERKKKMRKFWNKVSNAFTNLVSDKE